MLSRKVQEDFKEEKSVQTSHITDTSPKEEKQPERPEDTPEKAEKQSKSPKKNQGATEFNPLDMMFFIY